MAYQNLGILEGAVGAGDLEALRLLVSELVTNSVRHAGLGERGCIQLSVRVSDGVVYAVVSNPGKYFDARPVRPAPEQTSGWGLYLVDQVATRWGVLENTAGRDSTRRVVCPRRPRITWAVGNRGRRIRYDTGR